MLKEYLRAIMNVNKVSDGEYFRLKDNQVSEYFSGLTKHIYKYADETLYCGTDFLVPDNFITEILKGLIDNSIEITVTAVIPETIGEEYWTIDDYWTAFKREWQNTPFDFLAKENGMMFKTQESAEKAIPLFKEKWENEFLEVEDTSDENNDESSEDSTDSSEDSSEG